MVLSREIFFCFPGLMVPEEVYCALEREKVSYNLIAVGIRLAIYIDD